jgi:mRNA interferase RelE/StbE
VVYQIEFHPEALKAWRSIDNSVRIRLKKKLAERLITPDVPASRLSGDLSRMFKIKISSTGHRLIYEILEKEKILFVLSVGLRDDLSAYRAASKNSKD